MVRQLVLKLGFGIRATFCIWKWKQRNFILFGFCSQWLWAALGPTEYSEIKKTQQFKQRFKVFEVMTNTFHFKYLRSISFKGRSKGNAADRWADTGSLTILSYLFSQNKAEGVSLPTMHATATWEQTRTICGCEKDQMLAYFPKQRNYVELIRTLLCQSVMFS